MRDPGTPEADDFTRRAAGKRIGLLRELVGLLGENKKWWLTPILIALLLLGALVMLSGSATAPFIYTLF